MNIELTIKLEPDGKISIGGPLHDKILCLGLLELAKDVIKNYNPSAIQVAKSL